MKLDTFGRNEEINVGVQFPLFHTTLYTIVTVFLPNCNSINSYH